MKPPGAYIVEIEGVVDENQSAKDATEITYTLNEICSGAFTVALSDITPPCYTIGEENYSLVLPKATVTPPRCATKYPALIEYTVVSDDDLDVLQAFSEDANGDLVIDE